QEAPAVAEVERAPADRPAGPVDLPPLGMGLGDVLVPDHGRVGGHVDAVAAAGRDLLAEEVAAQAGMPPPDLGRVVGHAVVAAREDADRVDRGVLERADELVGVEVLADAGDQGRGVEVEVDVPSRKDRSHERGRQVGMIEPPSITSIWPVADPFSTSWTTASAMSSRWAWRLSGRAPALWAHCSGERRVFHQRVYIPPGATWL